LRDTVARVAPTLPPGGSGGFDQDGTFTFDALNVYANAPVDTDMVSAPAVGSARAIRFFIDHQRTSPGSFPNLDWPILLAELPVRPDGAVRNEHAPADLPLFEQLRSPADEVPITWGPTGPLGASHVAGMNFGRPGTTARCVGCHSGHSMIPVPAEADAASWSNLAPGAHVTVSSTREPQLAAGLIDRRARKARPDHIWSSRPGTLARTQWVQLEFPVPVDVRTVRLYAPERSDQVPSTLEIPAVLVRLLGRDRRSELARRRSGPLAAQGTEVHFNDVLAQVVRIEFSDTRGVFLNSQAALTEVEVIARGEPAR
jgi:hypothetical protein